MVRLHPKEESVWEIVDYKEITPTPTYSDEDAKHLNILRLSPHDVSGTYLFDISPSSSSTYRAAPALRFARRQLLKQVHKDGWNIFVVESWQVTKLRNSDNKKHRVEVHYRARPARANVVESLAVLDPATCSSPTETPKSAEAGEALTSTSTAPTSQQMTPETQTQTQTIKQERKHKHKRIDPPYLELVDAPDTDTLPLHLPTSSQPSSSTSSPKSSPTTLPTSSPSPSPNSRSKSLLACPRKASRTTVTRARSGSESSRTSSSMRSSTSTPTASPSKTRVDSNTNTSSNVQEPQSSTRTRKFLGLSTLGKGISFKRRSTSDSSSSNSSFASASSSDNEDATPATSPERTPEMKMKNEMPLSSSSSPSRVPMRRRSWFLPYSGPIQIKV